MLSQRRMSSITLALGFSCLLLSTSDAGYLRQDRSGSSSILSSNALDKYNNDRIRNITCIGDVPGGQTCEEFYLGLPSSPDESSSRQRIALEDGQDRVSALDHNDLFCNTGHDKDTSNEVVIEFIKYYYAVETDIGTKKGWINTIERKMFYAISADMLWCYKKNGNTVNIRDGGDRGRHQRQLVDTELEEVHNHPSCKINIHVKRDLLDTELITLGVLTNDAWSYSFFALLVD